MSKREDKGQTAKKKKKRKAKEKKLNRKETNKEKKSKAAVVAVWPSWRASGSWTTST